MSPFLATARIELSVTIQMDLEPLLELWLREVNPDPTTLSDAETQEAFANWISEMVDEDLGAESGVRGVSVVDVDSDWHDDTMTADCLRELFASRQPCSRQPCSYCGQSPCPPECPTRQQLRLL